MSASSRRRLRTRIIEWFVMPDPDPQPSRLDLDDHPVSRGSTAVSTDAEAGPRARAGSPADPATAPGQGQPATPAPFRSTPRRARSLPPERA